MVQYCSQTFSYVLHAFASIMDMATIILELNARGYAIVRVLRKERFRVTVSAYNILQRKKVAIILSLLCTSGEWRYWSQIQHSNILKLYDQGECAYTYIYIMEYARKGSIKDWLSRRLLKKNLSRNMIMKWFWQLVATMADLHDAQLYHLNIDISTVYLDEYADIKLGNLERLVYHGDRNIRFVNTLPWPPEIWSLLASERMRAGTWMEKTDAFLIGATFLELLTRKALTFSLLNPRADEAAIERYSSRLKEAVKQQLKFVRINELRYLLRKLLMVDPNSRYSCRQLMNYYVPPPLPKKPKKWYQIIFPCCKKRK